MVAEVTRWWLILMAILQAVTDTSGCTFPVFLTTSGRVWEKHITNQRGGSVQYHRYFARQVHITIPNHSGATKRYRQMCVENLGNDTYVVSQRMDRKSRGATVATQYKCVQFIRRSYYVIQLRTSPVGRVRHKSLCRKHHMNYDPWPMIWPSLRREYVPCGFSGGYNLNIFDGKRGSWLCTGMVARPRLESECLFGEGISLNFRDRACIPHGLAMTVQQRLFCLANWREGADTFIVLTDNAFAPHTWMLRLPTDQSGSFSAYIFRDVEAHSDDVITLTKDYVRLDFYTHVIDSLCSDEFPECSKQHLPCYSPFTESCPSHCKTCNMSSPGERCSFEENFAGKWTEHKVNWFPSPKHQRHRVTITDTNVTIAGFSSFKCMDFESAETKVMHRTPLVKIFENGCTPRFACIHLQKVGPSVMRYRLSQSITWPFTSSSNHHHHLICKDENFKYDIMPLVDTYRSEYEKNVVIATKEEREFVDCHIMSNFTVRAFFADGGGDCFGYFTQRCNASDSMTLMLHNCPGRRRLQHFKCLASFQEPTSSGGKIFKTIITESEFDSSETMCWIFNMQAIDSDEINMYMLAASECNRATHDAIKLYRYKKALIGFQIFKRQNVTCDVSDGNATTEIPFRFNTNDKLIAATVSKNPKSRLSTKAVPNDNIETDKIEYMLSSTAGRMFTVPLQLRYQTVFTVVITFTLAHVR